MTSVVRHLANGVVYALSRRTEIRASAAAGCGAPSCAPLATIPIGAETLESISISQGRLLVATVDHRVRAFGLTPDTP